MFYEVVADIAEGAWEANKGIKSFWQSDKLAHEWILPDNFHVKIKIMDTSYEDVIFMGKPFQVTIRENKLVEEGRGLCAHIAHSLDGYFVREITRRCSYDPNQIAAVNRILALGSGTRENTKEDGMVITLWNHYLKSGILSLRICDYLTADNVGHIDKKVLNSILASLPKKPFPVVAVHDCFKIHANYGNDIRKQYNIQLAELAKSNMLSYILSTICGHEVNIQKYEPNMYLDIIDTEYALS